MTKPKLYYACLGIPGCNHPVGEECQCECHKSEVGYKEDFDSKDWLGYVTTYVKRYCPEIKDYELLSIAGNLEQVIKSNKLTTSKTKT